MTNPFVSYSTLLLIFTAAFLLFVLMFVARRRKRTEPTTLQKMLAEPGIPEDQIRYQIPMWSITAAPSFHRWSTSFWRR